MKKQTKQLITFLPLFILIGVIIGFAVGGIILSLNDNSNNCHYENKKVNKIYFNSRPGICENCLHIIFNDCFDCEHYWNCYDNLELWYFENEFSQPKFKINDFVRINICNINGNKYINGVEKW